MGEARFSDEVMRAWRHFRQTIDALDLRLSTLEEHARASEDCVPLQDMADVQRLVTESVRESNLFVSDEESRRTAPQREVEADRNLELIQRRLAEDPDDCVPWDIAEEQIRMWRDTFEDWWGVTNAEPEHWNPAELNALFAGQD